MSFSKADPAVAAAALKTVRNTKGYKPPRKKRGRKKPGPKTLIRQVKGKRGTFSKEEMLAVEALVKSVDPDETEKQLQQRGKAMGIALRRSPSTMTKKIIEVREILAARLGRYADIHMHAAENAAIMGNSKPAEWALESIAVAGEKKGTVERVITPLKHAADNGPRMPTINVGIVLGGLTPGASLTPNQTGITVEAVRINDVEDEP